MPDYRGVEEEVAVHDFLRRSELAAPCCTNVAASHVSATATDRAVDFYASVYQPLSDVEDTAYISAYGRFVEPCGSRHRCARARRQSWSTLGARSSRTVYRDTSTAACSSSCRICTSRRAQSTSRATANQSTMFKASSAATRSSRRVAKPTPSALARS